MIEIGDRVFVNGYLEAGRVIAVNNDTRVAGVKLDYHEYSNSYPLNILTLISKQDCHTATMRFKDCVHND